jgi:hypothetical protein
VRFDHGESARWFCSQGELLRWLAGRTIAILTIREQQVGLLEVIMYLMGIIAVVAAVVWSWDLVLLLALILVALPFFTFWEIRNLEQENDLSRRPHQTLAKERAGGRP